MTQIFELLLHIESMKYTLFQKQSIKYDILPNSPQPKIVNKMIERSKSMIFFVITNQLRTFEFFDYIKTQVNSCQFLGSDWKTRSYMSQKIFLKFYLREYSLINLLDTLYIQCIVPLAYILNIYYINI